jgi:outer membrane protein OmpA-like peptidoglycan-associated protein
MTTTATRRAGLLAALALLAGSAASAQPASSNATPDTRPAFSTADGDTGLWYVPTAEVLAHGQWSASLYRVGLNYVPGFTNVADFPLTFAAGLFKRAEVFGSLKLDTRIDRDLRPIFTTDPDVGGVVGRYPFVTQGWSGNHLGDLLVGVKFNVMSEATPKRVALAVRGSLKLPTGDKDAGVSTGKTDGFVDLVVSKNRGVAEISGYAGGAFRGAPDGVSASNGFRYGFGAGFPAQGPIRVTAEWTGELPFDDTVTLSTPIHATDGSLASGTTTLQSFNAATLGVTWQSRKGIFVGAALTKTFPGQSRDDFHADSDPFGDFVDYQFRVGYHPGVRKYVAPAPPAPTPTPAPQPVANRPPTVTGRCEPCTVEVGRALTLSATGQDPDGDPLTYRWTVPSGTLASPAERQTQWTAPQQEGPVQATITVNDGKGGTASANVMLQVVRPAPVVELTFEDVYFDFDRSTLRPEALRLLDDAITKLQANPTKNFVIEGHTCNIGTSEYNLALGERRARSVLAYLTSRGIAANRLETRSYGEERPKFDNQREETRRLNRRAALVVKVQ